MNTDFEYPEKPKVLIWNRLEGQPRLENLDAQSEDQTAGRHFNELSTLRASVRDPLWLLTRQWQLGEFQGEDASTPISIKYRLEQGQIKDLVTNADFKSQYDPSAPLESAIEKIAIRPNLFFKIKMGNYWIKLLKKYGLGAYIAYFNTNFKIKLPDNSINQAGIYAHQKVWQSYAAAHNRGIDGWSIYDIIKGGKAFQGLNIKPSDNANLNNTKIAFVSWWNRQFAQPNSDRDCRWDETKLEYCFQCSVYEKDDGSTILNCPDYELGKFDWHSCDISTKESGNGIKTPDDKFSVEIKAAIPTSFSFAGMPRDRWWEFEDKKVSFGMIDAGRGDLAKLLLSDFALTYCNDWFMIPCQVKTGAMARITGMIVTDVFGLKHLIRPAGTWDQPGWEGWHMFNTVQDKEGSYSYPEKGMFVPPVAVKTLEGPVLEKVNFIRDEVANLVWGVEKIITMDNGYARDGFEAALEMDAFLKSNIIVAPSAPEEKDAKLRYRLSNDIPDNWIPFVPVRVESIQGSPFSIQLMRTFWRRPYDLEKKVPPRTAILQVGMDTNANEIKKYYINEEEVIRPGAIIQQNFQRTRWINGKVVTWLGRKKTFGRDKGSSGLRFDLIENI